MITNSYTVPPGSVAEFFAPRKRLALSIPIRPHVHAEVDLPQSMTETDWQQFLAVLEAMKPGLVREPEGAPAEQDGEA